MASTVLTLEMAKINARLLVAPQALIFAPQSFWLKNIEVHSDSVKRIKSISDVGDIIVYDDDEHPRRAHIIFVNI